MTTEIKQRERPRHKRRWFQFGLAKLLIVVGILSVWLGLQVHWANRQKQAVAAIRSLGASVEYDFERSGFEVEPPGPDWLYRRVGPDFFSEVAGVNWWSQPEAGLVHVSTLSELKRLDLRGTNVTDLGLSHLRGLTKLEILFITGSRFTDAGLQNLAGLAKLRSLSLSRTPLTDAGLAHLSRLTNLEWLALNETQITDAGLVYLSRIESLQWLDLNETHITDAGLLHLARLQDLKSLQLGWTHVTDAGCHELRQALPDCEIHRRSGIPYSFLRLKARDRLLDTPPVHLPGRNLRQH